jgi:UDP-N-acetylmuramoyl-tripeptide--D-alanyl-D-alanine ligase
MKSLLKNKLIDILRFFSKRILNKYQPKVVAITGSVGKTSTSEAIFTVLSSDFRVRKSIKNYNNEIGVPLTIIGVESGGRSILKWLNVLSKAIKLILSRDQNYPEVLVLEMGADRPGDISYLTSFVKPDVAVVTAVAAVHIAAYDSIEDIAKEKSALVRALSKKGCAFLNLDDQRVSAMAAKTKARVFSFGFNQEADIAASEIAVSHDIDLKDIATIQGVSFKLKVKGVTVPVLLPRVLGEHLVYTALAAIGVGMEFGINLHTILESLKSFEPPKGRMHLLRGVKQTLIIDDTYNASPLSTTKALKQLGSFNLNRDYKTYAILGDMLELGSYSEQAHIEVGQAVVEYGVDYLVAVGELSKSMIQGATKSGMTKENCFSFADPVIAARFVQDRLKTGDIILIKGSQGARMERAVKELMAEPQRAEELLVRQDDSWK